MDPQIVELCIIIIVMCRMYTRPGRMYFKRSKRLEEAQNNATELMQSPEGWLIEMDWVDPNESNPTVTSDSKRIVGRGGNTRQPGKMYDRSRPRFADAEIDDEENVRWRR